MNEPYFHQPSVSEALYVQAIGKDVMEYIQDRDADILAQLAENEAIRLLDEIRRILNDPDLEDATCFMRINAIVSAFLRSGVPVDRHDF